MSLYSQFGTDKAAEIDGTPIEFAANDDGTTPTFWITRMGGANKRYGAALTKRTRPHAMAIRNNTLNEDVARNISLDVFIETVLVNWDNVYNRDGKSMAFTAQAARQLFTDLPDLYEALVTAATNLTTFQVAELETTVKNS